MYFKSCEETAQEMGVTRQFISQTTKSGLRKVFNNVSKLYPHLSNKEIFGILCNTFNFKEEIQMKAFFKAFPKEIQKSIYISS